MCEQLPYYEDACGVIQELEEAGALTEQQSYTLFNTLQQIGYDMELINQRLNRLGVEVREYLPLEDE